MSVQRAEEVLTEPTFPKILPDEIAVRSVLPALRAAVARELTQSFHLTQYEIATKLGLTQAAINHYLKEKRGSVAGFVPRNPKVKQMCSEIATILAKESFDQREVASKFDSTLRYVKGHRLLCPVHKLFEPDLSVPECHICDAPELPVETGERRGDYGL